MNTIIQQQTLAALIAAPEDLARTTVTRLEPDDFGDWQYRTIFTEGLMKCRLADHPEPGSVIVQINRHLLAAGLYQDTDNGLRATVTTLAGVVGHPEQLHVFVDDLAEQRFRKAAADFSLSVAQHAQVSPLEDVDAALRHVEELRRLRARIRPLQAVKQVTA